MRVHSWFLFREVSEILRVLVSVGHCMVPKSWQQYSEVFVGTPSPLLPSRPEGVRKEGRDQEEENHRGHMFLLSQGSQWDPDTESLFSSSTSDYLCGWDLQTLVPGSVVDLYSDANEDLQDLVVSETILRIRVVREPRSQVTWQRKVLGVSGLKFSFVFV